MPIYEVRPDGPAAVLSTKFEIEQMRERSDIQRLLMGNIACLGDDLKVLAEEFSGWLDSSRRIDLLCIDTDANLVVVEIKRTDDGGHIELQALRYAAMASAMTFDQAVDTLARHLRPSDPDQDAARAELLSFLRWEAPNEARFGTDTRIVLASADFSKEVTTTGLCLLDRGIDICCVRLKPYRLEDGRVLVDIHPLIPLPEAAAFQTQIGVKRMAERKDREERHQIRYHFWDVLLAAARTRTELHANRRPNNDGWISGGIGRSGFRLSYVTRQLNSHVELWIDADKGAFRQLLAEREAIEQEFGCPLEWHELPDGDGSGIRYHVDGGYRSLEEEWPRIHNNMIDAMVRLDRVFRRRVQAMRS